MTDFHRWSLNLAHQSGIAATHAEHAATASEREAWDTISWRLDQAMMVAAAADDCGTVADARQLVVPGWLREVA